MIHHKYSFSEEFYFMSKEERLDTMVRYIDIELNRVLKEE